MSGPTPQLIPNTSMETKQGYASAWRGGGGDTPQEGCVWEVRNATSGVLREPPYLLGEASMGSWGGEGGEEGKVDEERNKEKENDDCGDEEEFEIYFENALQRTDFLSWM